MQCAFYRSDACLCPARRLKWWSLQRWLLGPHPLCIFDEIDMWWGDTQSDQLSRAYPMVCPHLVPLKEKA